jgi:tetratricopeptide (TPR) repeat protein
VVRIHRAELHELEGRPAAALAAYEALLDEGTDPVVAARAFAVAQRLGDADRAARHFDVAERGLRSALDAGEVYTLGPLARLYADAGRDLDHALRLAEENLHWKRDREALRTLALIKARLGAPDTLH